MQREAIKFLEGAQSRWADLKMTLLVQTPKTEPVPYHHF